MNLIHLIIGFYKLIFNIKILQAIVFFILLVNTLNIIIAYISKVITVHSVYRLEKIILGLVKKKMPIVLNKHVYCVYLSKKKRH